MRKRRRRHPVEVYVDEPLLCEYLWQKENATQDDETNDETTTNSAENSNSGSNYASYRKKYCLDFIRSFFNAHLDDEWFRERFSPLCRRSVAIRRRERSIREATLLKEVVSHNEASLEMFLSQCRLGIGTKTKKRKRGDSSAGIDDPDEDGKEETMHVPLSHMLSGAGSAVKMSDVPPYVTDGQILHAVREHGGASATSGVRICGSTVGLGEGGSSSCSLQPKYCNSLARMVWVVFPTKDAKDEFIDNLTKANIEANRATPTPQNRTIPTKQLPTPPTLELDIDCTDTYSRTEIDYDGKGSAPPLTDGHSSIKKPPTKKCTVIIHPLYNALEKQQLVVLSASLSSKERISRDKTAALMLARAMDTLHIPSGLRLDDLLSATFNSEDDKREEDVLDVAIAYLRRVHLFSFYNACGAQREGDVMSGLYPTGPIHLRLKDADKILEKMEGEAGGVAPTGDAAAGATKDMLVMRLDEGIAKALEESQSRIGSEKADVDEKTDELAKEIEQMEDKSKKTWMHDHGLLDADGRARCSFHFCRKLFKDKTFLHKHLLKKHPEYLVAEQAKCHDNFMMQAWETEEVRPLPQILVDCGSRFGFVPVTVTGCDPDVVDPEPEIHAKEEERIKRLEEEERERYQQRNANYHKNQRNDYHAGNMPENYSNSNEANPKAGGNQNSGFVDVDDMKDEKVEINFDNVDVPMPPTKKKKKKKKKLL